MSALHRQLLKRRHGQPVGRFAQSEYIYGEVLAQHRRALTTSAGPSSACVEPPASPPVDANAHGTCHLPDGSNFVEPEGSDAGAMLRDGSANSTATAASVRDVAHDPQVPATSVPAALSTEATLAERLQQRLVAMFMAGPGAPRRSFLEPVADVAHLWLLVAVEKEAATFWAAHEEDARKYCQPSLISETEIRGYLANDALGNTLLPPGYGTHCPDAVGKRVHNGVVKAVKDAKAARKTACAAARAAARKGITVDAGGADAAEQAALAAVYNLQLPGGMTRHPTHKTANIMSRQELSMAGADVELPQLLKDICRMQLIWLTPQSGELKGVRGLPHQPRTRRGGCTNNSSPWTQAPAAKLCGIERMQGARQLIRTIWLVRLREWMLWKQHVMQRLRCLKQV